MGENFRIVNITNGYRMKPNQVERAIMNCSVEWVERGVSVRSLSVAEAIKSRNEQAKKREPLAYAEVPGLSYEPSLSGQKANQQAKALVRAAHEFCMMVE